MSMANSGRMMTSVLAAVLATGLCGCGGDARIELAAAQSVDALAGSVQEALSEYHGEIETADDEREAAVVAAFVTRVQRDAGDEPAADAHAAQFTAAMGKIRADRRVEWTRYQAAGENVAALHEVAAGLRRLAIESMSLEDEARRYIYSLVEAAGKPGAGSVQAAP